MSHGKPAERGSCHKLWDLADLESPSLVCGLSQRQVSDPVPGRVPPSFEAVAENRLLIKSHIESRCELPGIARSTFLMVFSPDGKKIASTHGNHSVYITDVKTGKNLNTLTGHPRTPWCIAFHPSSNQILATGCLGGQVRVWDLHGGSEMWMTRGETVIASLVFHPVDHMLVIATYNELYFWDWSKPTPFAKCHTANEKEKVRYVSFDESGHRLVTGISNMQPYVTQWDRGGPEDWGAAAGSVEEDGGHGRLLTPHFRALLAHYEQLMERLPPLRPASLVDRGTDPMEVEPGSNTLGESFTSGRSDAPSQSSTARTDNATDGQSLYDNILLRGHRFRDTIIDCYNITREADDILGQLRRREQPHHDVQVELDDPVISTSVPEDEAESSTAGRGEVSEERMNETQVESNAGHSEEVLGDAVEPNSASLEEASKQMVLDRAMESNVAGPGETNKLVSNSAMELNVTGVGETDEWTSNIVGKLNGEGPSDSDKKVSNIAVELNEDSPRETNERMSDNTVESNATTDTGKAVKEMCTTGNYGMHIRSISAQFEHTIVPGQCLGSEPSVSGTNSALEQVEQNRPKESSCLTTSGTRQSELELHSLHVCMARTIFILEQASRLRDESALTGSNRRWLLSALLESFREQEGTAATHNLVEPSPTNVASSDEVTSRNVVDGGRVSENLASLLMADNDASSEDGLAVRFVQKALRNYIGKLIAKLTSELSTLLSEPNPLSPTIDQELLGIHSYLHRLRTMYVRSSLIRDCFNEATSAQSGNSGQDNTIHLIDRASNEITALRSKKVIAKINAALRPYYFNSDLFERLRTISNPGAQDANKPSGNSNIKNRAHTPGSSMVPDEESESESEEGSGSEDSRQVTTTLPRYRDAGTCDTKHKIGHLNVSPLVNRSTDSHDQHDEVNKSAQTVAHSGEENVVNSTRDSTPSDSNKQGNRNLEGGNTSELLSSRHCSNMMVLEIHEETEMLIKLLNLVRSVVVKMIRISEQASDIGENSSSEVVREGASGSAGENQSEGEVEHDTFPAPSSSGFDLRARALAADEEAANLISKIWNWRSLNLGQSRNVSSSREPEIQHARALFELSLINLEVKLVANKVHELLSTHGEILGVSMPSHWGYAVDDARSNVSTQFREWERLCSASSGSDASRPVDASNSNQNGTLDNSVIEQETSILNDKIKAWVERRPGGSCVAGPSRVLSEPGEGTSGSFGASHAPSTSQSVGEIQADSSGNTTGANDEQSPTFVSNLREMISDSLHTASADDPLESDEELAMEPAPERSHRGGWTYFPRRLRPEERLYVSPRSAFQPHVRRPQAASEEGGGLARVEQSIDRLSRNLDDTLRLCRARLEVLELYQLQNLWEELRTHIRSLQERVRVLREASRQRTDAAVGRCEPSSSPTVEHSSITLGPRQSVSAATLSPLPGRLADTTTSASADAPGTDIGQEAGSSSALQAEERSVDPSLGMRAAMGSRHGSSRIIQHLCSVMSRMNRRLSVSRRHCSMGTRSLDSRHATASHRRTCGSLRVHTYLFKMCPNRGSRTERAGAGDRGGRSQAHASCSSADQARGARQLCGGVRGVKRRAEDTSSPPVPPIPTPPPLEPDLTYGTSSQQPFWSMIHRLEALVVRHNEQQQRFQRELARLRTSATRQRGTADDDLYQLLQLALQITGCLLTQLVNSSRRMESVADSRQQEVGARRQRTFMVPSVRVNDVPLSETAPSSPPPRRMPRLSSPPPPIALRFQHLYGDSSQYVRPRFLHPRYVAWPDPFSTDPDNPYLGPPFVIRADLSSPQTHRIQVWDFSEYFIPDISKADENVVVSECKIHNDASVDISRDGSMLVALMPSDHYENVTNTLGIYSLLPDTRGQCLYTTNFEQNAVSVSFSPTGRHLLIGVAISRATLFSTDANFLARIYRLSGTKADAKGRLLQVRNFERTREHAYMSVNCIRWLPTAGQGFVYGTNTGQLRILR